MIWQHRSTCPGELSEIALQTLSHTNLKLCLYQNTLLADGRNKIF